MMRGKSPFRTLTVVYALAILAGIVEIVGGPSREPDIYGDPKRSFPDAFARLYPGSSEAEYLLGRRFEAAAGRNFNQDELRRNSVLMQQFMTEVNGSLREAARHYERAIAMGLKSEENLYYNYALTLIRIQAEPDRIDQAIAMWRQNFPYSARRDLEERRKSLEQLLRQLPPVSSAPAAGGGETEAALDFVPEWRTASGYVGSEACRQCHPREFESYLATHHSRALVDVKPEAEPADAVFDHAASGRRYRVARRDGQLFHEESLLLDDGTEFELTSQPVRYRVGSGHYARTYLCEADGGFLFESPVTWYESAQSWGMTPGFDKPAHRSFSRHVLENCLWCHSGQISMSTTSTFRLRPVENAIGCERCHGPGEAHVDFQQAPRTVARADDPIVNPRRLTRRLAEAVCQQCHLQGDIPIGGRNVRASDYRPGQSLEQFSTVYRHRKRETEMTVVGHVEQLGASACYRRSETLTCVTCHDPHHAPKIVAPGDRMEHYRTVCNSCHADRGCKLDFSIRESRSQNDCVQCHMPKSATEVPHVAFTHHHIGIHPLKKDAVEADPADPFVALSDLSQLSERDRERSLMLARLESFRVRGAAFQQPIRGHEMARQVDTWLQGLPPEEVDIEIEFARSQFLFARRDQAGAEQFAARALAFRDIRSEEEAVLLDELGQMEFRQSRYEQARQRFGKLALLRRQGQDWFYLGLSEEHCGNPAAAILALEMARRLEPSEPAIYEALARIRKSQGDFAAEKRIRDEISKLRRRLPKASPN